MSVGIYSNFFPSVGALIHLRYYVDSGAYMHCLARDIGAAPSVSCLVKEAGWRAAIAYTMGQAFTPFFRIVGPFADKHSAHVASTELYDTVRLPVLLLAYSIRWL